MIKFDYNEKRAILTVNQNGCRKQNIVACSKEHANNIIDAITINHLLSNPELIDRFLEDN